MAGEVKSNNIKGRVLVDTGAGVNIITKSYAEKIGAKLAVGSGIRMIFADGRETTSHLQTNMEFKLGEVSSSAKFRVLTNLLPEVDMILGKPWLRNAGPAFNFETGSVSVNGTHAQGPKITPMGSNIPSDVASSSTKAEVSVSVIEESVATKMVETGSAVDGKHGPETTPLFSPSPMLLNTPSAAASKSTTSESSAPVMEEPVLSKIAINVFGARRPIDGGWTPDAAAGPGTDVEIIHITCDHF